MRIDSSSTPIPAIPSDKPAESPVQRTHHQHAPADVVQLSAAGAAASSSRTSAADPKRLASIKAAIQSGTYPVDLDKLAGKIVDEDA
jgi:flagellar biosynthesis anti-sigma factor FlgM|nr:flagellar biosynthesis anti-sigma factor FlgM [Kofleriaceae bacterium]